MIPVNETFDYSECAICIDVTETDNQITLSFIDVFDWNTGHDDPDNYFITFYIKYSGISKNFDFLQDLKHREIKAISITADQVEYFNFLPNNFINLSSIESCYLKMAGNLEIKFNVNSMKVDKKKIIK